MDAEMAFGHPDGEIRRGALDLTDQDSARRTCGTAVRCVGHLDRHHVGGRGAAAVRAPEGNHR
ncbi:hypothetical protein E0500_028060 [Streptomyces sp. KM273126]|uniref:hypothetical protein n=1 Tax=Streptomyces sp. KM273126 TaxID=2545247 RepID=UPI0014048792|nr:hypothetical protein [Streptomyces sp. KM273126]MBA2811153.1 hypothetical protein [Streptomyces sp. KM273126]